MRIVDMVRLKLRTLLWRDRVEGELDEELRFHVEMQTEENIRAGMSPKEARRQAGITFGGVERHKEEVREAHGLTWLSAMSLDFKLGLRMLIKYPGLTLVGVLGMAVAIAISAGFFAVMRSYLLPPLPLEEGKRVIALESWDAVTSEPERQILHDFTAWREELKPVGELSAFSTIRRNLIVPGGSIEPVRVAEMTASGFRVARVPPLLGRYLVEEDEQAGALPVVVIGYDVWQSRFAGAPNIVGREIRLGSSVHTVVGVMPQGYAFPTNHRFWVPLRADPSEYKRREGPAIQIFGRLAPGATLDQARAELTAIGRRTAAASPETHRQLRPRIVPFTTLFSPVEVSSSWMVYLVQLIVSLLLVVVAVNVAVLVYARTATRRGEIAVRSALGASRLRIVAQLFAEALVLAGVAAVVGLLLAGVVVSRLHTFMVEMTAPHGGLPFFWKDAGLPGSTVVYVLGLAILGAVIVGVVPALQTTGRRMQSSLRELGGGTGMQLGRTWTALIIAQVAIAVAVLPLSVFTAWEYMRYGFAEPGFAAEEFLSAELEMDREYPSSTEAEAYNREFAGRYRDRAATLAERLEADPGVREVTFMMDLPGHEYAAPIEVDGEAPRESATRRFVRFGQVDVDFFDVFDVPLLAGRRFHSGDLGDAATPVIVNRTFVQEVLGGGNALGRQIRYVSDGAYTPPEGTKPGQWYEIVGVVSDFPNPMNSGTNEARMYHPLAAGQLYPTKLAVRVQGGTPAAFASRLREITTGLDPALRPHEVAPLDEVYTQGEQALLRVGAWAILLVILTVLLLSAAGIYALMSFTVTRRRREIGIRTALGADSHRILRSIFSRAVGQLTIGVVVGIGLAALLDNLAGGDLREGAGAMLFLLVAALMLTVGLLAAIGPARRGLRIEPMEVLKADA